MVASHNQSMHQDSEWFFRQPRMKAVVPNGSLHGARCDLASGVLNAALDAVLLDFKAANAREIDWLVVWVGASAERVEVLGARPPLEDIDPGGVHRIGGDREVETPG